jgi:hypothetical protein
LHYFAVLELENRIAYDVSDSTQLEAIAS